MTSSRTGIVVSPSEFQSAFRSGMWIDGLFPEKQDAFWLRHCVDEKKAETEIKLLDDFPVRGVDVTLKIGGEDILPPKMQKKL